VTILELRLGLAVMLIWSLAVATTAAWRTSPKWIAWALFLPVVLFLRVNPFSSPLTGLVFVTLASGLAVLFGLSLPFGWAFTGHLGGLWAILISAALLVIPFLLQGTAPRRRWIGVVLAGFLGPWGQWYLEDGGRWLVVVWVLAFAAGLLGQLVSIGGGTAGGVDSVRLPEFPQLWWGWPGMALHAASAVVMYLRFNSSGINSPVASVQ
jgi:hypothetical protein